MQNLKAAQVPSVEINRPVRHRAAGVLSRGYSYGPSIYLDSYLFGSDFFDTNTKTEVHGSNFTFDRAFALNKTERVIVGFARNDQGNVSEISASLDKAEARALRDALNNLDLD